MKEFQLFNDDLSELPSDKILINTINQYSYCIAEKDEVFKNALINSDVLLPDGIGIVVASKILHGKKLKKIAGADLHHFLLQKLNKEGGKCFYLGSSKNTLSKIKEKVMECFPNIICETYSPPYKAEFDDHDNDLMIKAVNNFAPDVLFIGLTAPKQEKWAFKFKNSLNAKIICSIGAVFDFYAGTIKRPSKIWIFLGLEWFVRLVKEPKRMTKRYLYYGPIFIYYIVKEKFKRFNKLYKTS
jgi:N-acetylglucosaminyldiphosphoundecaprenol N-acetyl-beta-D-mannosaminyltransferase